jgi:ubiquinone/menaquinone biosynthesis C-methylase UbiE
MQQQQQIISLYSSLAEDPSKEFGWKKGRENALALGYNEAWFEALPTGVWDYCAAVGNPFEQGEIGRNECVVDLGCGAGIDLLVAAFLSGPEGRAIGIDITPKMVAKAKEHAQLGGFSQVEVYESDFESIPLEDATADVVISNGAINLSACKQSVFAEIYRLLKPGGRLLFADIIDTGEAKPAASCCAAPSEADWANCVAGTLSKEKLMEIMAEAGFGEIECTGLTGYTTSETTEGATFRAVKIPAEKRRKAHWENVYTTKDYTQVLWHQSSPDLSLNLIKALKLPHDAAIIDVGCGASLLADALIEKGHTDLCLLDASAVSLEIVRQRLGEKSEVPAFICADVTAFKSPPRFDLWHDRAVFHFLLHASERSAYFKALHTALKEGGTAIISTFSPTGPAMCSGLDVIRYDEQKMRDELPAGLHLIKSEEVLHLTPKESYQNFAYFIIEKKIIQGEN